MTAGVKIQEPGGSVIATVYKSTVSVLKPVTCMYNMYMSLVWWPLRTKLIAKA